MLPAAFVQWMPKPTKSVCARLRAAVPAWAICELRPSIHSGEPSPNTRVMSPVWSVAYTVNAPPLA